jgi:hypothetical protein
VGSAAAAYLYYRVQLLKGQLLQQQPSAFLAQGEPEGSAEELQAAEYGALN